MPSKSKPPKAISLLGIPLDMNSTYLRGAAEAPPRIREALRCDSSNLWTEDGVDLGHGDVIHDCGDLELPSAPEAAAKAIEHAVARTLQLGHPLISLGGDHSITYPILRGFHSRFPNLTILHFDAHPDLYDNLCGRLSHATPFARIMEERLARRLVQVGIRTLNQHQHEQAKRFGVEIISMRNFGKAPRLKVKGPLYISLDIDVLDPAFAPGISHYEPGGMSVREVLNVIQSVRALIVGADIVEYNPVRDREDQTAMVAGKFLKEIAAAMLRGGRAPKTGWA
ncbi:MAG TPA: agmatinase [Candidatus Sulfotelmatobacter sp.]|nr:agmatinase [Candidatus Sulfotelmatobacter sp.]